MRDRLALLCLTLLLAGVIIFGAHEARQRHSEELNVAAPVAADIAVCPKPPTVCLTIAVPTTITLPPVTVTRVLTVRPVTVRVPTVTVRVPPITVTSVVRLPPVIRTLIVQRTIFPPPLVQPGRTVTVQGLPGATKTVTVVVNKEIVRNGTAAPVTREVRTTTSQRVTTGQATTTRGTIVPKKEKQVIHIPGGTVTKFQAVGIGLLALIALMAAGMILLWLGFILGFRNAEKNNISFLKALRDYAKRKPGQHEIG